jgi:zeaxanthin epoxidase
MIRLKKPQEYEPVIVWNKKRPMPPEKDSLRVMIAGGGIGGLCTALALLKDGHDVQVFEKTTQFRPFGGPIQIATNALEAIRRIDPEVHGNILNAATTIGNRKNGLKDGISNDWFATFDLWTPAQKVSGEPSVVIDRPILQKILLDKVKDRVTTGMEVVSYEQKEDNFGVIGHLANGETFDADVLIGSDGIHSKVARNFYHPHTPDPVWSGYTCFAGIADCVPEDIKEVGYKVFLGNKKYFVSVDVGGGRIQWYAFLNIPPRTLNLTGDPREWLKQTQFPGWTEEVGQLIDCTPRDQIEQRDLYDRRPELKWAEGNVCLLGDAVHPMMPNLGQGGGMAIEDALVLGQEIRSMKKRQGLRRQVTYALQQYGDKRALRAAAVQGMSRISSAFLFQYRPPLTLESMSPLKFSNVGLRSAITRSMQGFLQHVAFPMQFEFLFNFPGNAVEPEIYAEDEFLQCENDFVGVLTGKINGADFWDRYMRV